MVGIGFLMIGLALWGLFMAMGDLLDKRSKGLRFFFWALPLPYLANSFGWILTELGRFPWIVYGLMKIEDGVSTVVQPGMVMFSLVLYTLVYAALIVATIYLFVKFAKSVPGSQPEPELDLTPSLVSAQD